MYIYAHCVRDSRFQMPRRGKGLAVGVLVVAIAILAAGEDCSGHGTKDDAGTCVCDNAWPTDVVQPGFVGRECEVPVYAGSGDGTDMTGACIGKHCQDVAADGWACWAVPLPADTPWNYLAIFINRTSGGGDPDLYSWFKETTPPDFQVPKGFDFQDTSAGPQPVVRKTVSKAEFGDADFKHEGVYLCVHNYGNDDITVSVSAMLTQCPALFDAAGVVLQCSTPLDAPEEARRFSDCTAAGECVCRPPWAKPVQAVYPRLGFEECSSTTVTVNVSMDAPFVANNENVDAERWVFYGFDVDVDDFQVAATVVERTAGRVDMFAKAGAPPGAQAQQFDLRPEWNAATADRELQIILDPSHPKYRTGPWFIGVAASELPANYTFSLAKYACPMNCSSNGACNAATHACTCQEGFGGSDCSRVTMPLEWGIAATRNATSKFEYEFYVLPAVSDAMLLGNVEVEIQASFSSSSYSRHLEARPVVLISALGDGSFPSATNFTHRLVLADPEQVQSLVLCSSQLRAGEWKLAVYNPLPTAPIAFSVVVSKVGRCLNQCSTHGTCTDTGVCNCASGWAGGDCSVDIKGRKGGSKAGTFLKTSFSMLLGAAAVLALIHFRGVPAWLPMRNAAFGGVGLYQELTEHEGI